MGNSDRLSSKIDHTWDYSDPVKGPTIPAQYFYDPIIFAEEKVRIFRNVAPGWSYQ